MFPKIHNSPKYRKHWPTAGLIAFMGAFAIAVVASSAPAYAHCLRHIYNNSNSFFHIQIFEQPSNNVVDRDIPPKGSSSYWLISDGYPRTVWVHDTQLTIGDQGLLQGHWVAHVDPDSCYLQHDGGNFPKDGSGYYNYRVVWNEPADGDITICGGIGGTCP